MNDPYDDPGFNEAYARESAAIDEMKADATKLEADILRQRETMPMGALFALSDAEDMEYHRRNGHDYGPDVDNLDSMYQGLGALQEAIIERERALGYW